MAGLTCALLLIGLGAVPKSTPKKTEPKVPKALRVLSVSVLPIPQTTGKMSVEEALALRRSIRNLSPDDLSMTEISQLLWAAQGISEPRRGRRTAPSAGGTYPIEIFAVTRRGLARYAAPSHSLEWLDMRDLREALSEAAAKQDSVRAAPLDIVIAGVPERTTPRYGDRAGRYVYLEAGHVAQNILLQATALGLGAVPIGAFLEEPLAKTLRLPANYYPLYLIPVGRPRPGELEAARQGVK